VTDLRPDFFEALARPLRARIQVGELRPGALLPSESELAKAAGTKRYSIRKALNLLHDEGLIDSVPGRGWAVRDLSAAASGVGGALPRYRRIAAELRTAIERGELPPGAVLPSEGELVVRHAVSRATVRQALALLESEGRISTRPGRGRYVRGH
jgi:DNA-binding GntR family transcriptional regulator